MRGAQREVVEFAWGCAHQREGTCSYIEGRSISSAIMVGGVGAEGDILSNVFLHPDRFCKTNSAGRVRVPGRERGLAHKCGVNVAANLWLDLGCLWLDCLHPLGLQQVSESDAI